MTHASSPREGQTIAPVDATNRAVTL